MSGWQKIKTVATFEFLSTVKRPGWRLINSSACVPIEPVEPSTSTDRLPVIACHHPRPVVVRRYGRGEQLP